MNAPAQTEMLDELAFEVALGYFNEDAICLRYGLSRKELSATVNTDDFQVRLNDQQRKIDERGDKFRLVARRYAEGVLKQLRDIATDPDTAQGTKIKAIDALCRYAGYEGDEQAVAGVQLQIVTNLEVGRATAGNSYIIEARPVSEAGAEDLI